MFSALKFIAAGVIVALFGGFLLAGILTTQQGDDVVPGAVTQSPGPEVTSVPTEAPEPSVRTDILPGVTLTVEVVEPGVFRVIDDDVRDLAKANNLDIVAGHDGGIWLLRPQRFLRLGADEWLAWATEKPEYVSDFEVAPDGTVWVHAEGGPSDVIQSFDGEGWTTHHEATGGPAVEVTPDGIVWSTWWDPERQRPVFGYLAEDGWQALADGVFVTSLRVASPDDIWGIEIDFLGPDHFVRFVDGAWERMDDVDLPLAALGPDGTFWGAFLGDDDLVRFDGSEWSRWPLEDTGFHAGPAGVEVATDGSVWYASGSPADNCGGVARFDGVTPDRYLSGLCVEAIDITTDGSVWLLATEADSDLRHVYVITPEAVAATE
jgi:hypothetical protein